MFKGNQKVDKSFSQSSVVTQFVNRSKTVGE